MKGLKLWVPPRGAGRRGSGGGGAGNGTACPLFAPIHLPPVCPVRRVYHLPKRIEHGDLLPPIDGTVNSVVFYERHMLTSLDTGALVVWRVRDWEPLLTLRAHKYVVGEREECSRVARSGLSIIVWTTDIICLASKPRSSHFCSRPSALRGNVASLSVHPSGNFALTVGESDRRIKLWNLIKGRCVHQSKLDKQPESVCWSPSGAAYAVVVRSRVDYYVVDEHNSAPTHQLPIDHSLPSKTSPSSSLYSSSSSSSSSSASFAAASSRPPVPLCATFVSEQLLAVGCDDGAVRVYDVERGCLSAVARVPGDSRVKCVSASSFSSSCADRVLVSASSDGSICLWSASNQWAEPLRTLHARGRVSSLCAEPIVAVAASSVSSSAAAAADAARSSLSSASSSSAAMSGRGAARKKSKRSATVEDEHAQSGDAIGNDDDDDNDNDAEEEDDAVAVPERAQRRYKKSKQHNAQRNDFTVSDSGNTSAQLANQKKKKKKKATKKQQRNVDE